jgi:hypothetical protein
MRRRELLLAATAMMASQAALAQQKPMPTKKIPASPVAFV